MSGAYIIVERSPKKPRYLTIDGACTWSTLRKQAAPLPKATAQLQAEAFNLTAPPTHKYEAIPE